MNDNFFDHVSKLQGHLYNYESCATEKIEEQSNKSQTTIGSPSLKLPDYDRTKDYHTEFYNIFCQNQSLMQRVEMEARDRNDIMMQIMKINEFYDQNIEKRLGDRYESGRKIHERRKMCELKREFKCPYENCDKVYASEGAVNLHIKNKHHGGNKTEREKLAKSLVYCKAKGMNVPDKLEINLPPQIVQQAAVEISKMTDVQIREEDLLTLREKLQI